MNLDDTNLANCFSSGLIFRGVIVQKVVEDFLFERVYDFLVESEREHIEN